MCSGLLTLCITQTSKLFLWPLSFVRSQKKRVAISFVTLSSDLNNYIQSQQLKFGFRRNPNFQKNTSGNRETKFQASTASISYNTTHHRQFQVSLGCLLDPTNSKWDTSLQYRCWRKKLFRIAINFAKLCQKSKNYGRIIQS